MYDLLYEYPVGIGGGEAGIEADADYIYTSLWNDSLFIRYEHDGTFFDTFSIPGVEHIRDLAYDGSYFYGGASAATLYEMDFTNQTLISTITAPTDIRAIAWDAVNDCFWANNWSSNITQFDRNGNVINSYSCGAFGSFYGFAWEELTSGGPYLWGYSQDGNGNELVKMDIAAGCIQVETYDIADSGLNYTNTDIAGGLFISQEVQGFEDYQVIGGMIQNLSFWGLELGWVPSLDVPMAPSDFTAITDPSGAQEVTLSWTAPTHTMAGNPLTNLLEYRIYLDDMLIYTGTNPVVGAFETYLHVGAPGGMHSYRVAYLNSFGGGPYATATLWVGEDVPGPVINGTLIGNVLSWENPTTGLHNGPFNNPIIGYHLTRSDGVVFELAGIMTSFTDDTIPQPGYYSYEIVPYNIIGDGGVTVILPGIIPPPMIYESFDTFPPDGWTITGGTNWQASATNNAGGYAPEAQFHWSPSTVGIQRLITTSLDGAGFCWEFCSMIDDYIGGYTVSFEASPDLVNWTQLWVLTPTGNQNTTQVFGAYFNPTPDQPLYFAFCFDGDSYNIDNWYVDDLLVQEAFVPPVVPVTGNVALHGGNGAVHDVLIQLNYETTHPDDNGDFMIDGWLWSTSTFTASLDCYAPFDTTFVLEDSLWLPVDLWYFEPPVNTEALVVNDHVILEWDAPDTPLEVLEYFVYRDDQQIGATGECSFADLEVPPGQHSYWLCTEYEDGVSVPGDTVMVDITHANPQEVPAVNALLGNYPNPFNPETIITFSVVSSEQVTDVSVYNCKGQKVKTLVNEPVAAGLHNVEWNGRDDAGNSVSSGVYFCRMKSGVYRESKKMILMK
jgi:hypothetical protein